MTIFKCLKTLDDDFLMPENFGWRFKNVRKLWMTLKRQKTFDDYFLKNVGKLGWHFKKCPNLLRPRLRVMISAPEDGEAADAVGEKLHEGK
jgi:hypothetical protein